MTRKLPTHARVRRSPYPSILAVIVAWLAFVHAYIFFVRLNSARSSFALVGTSTPLSWWELLQRQPGPTICFAAFGTILGVLGVGVLLEREWAKVLLRAFSIVMCAVVLVSVLTHGGMFGWPRGNASWVAMVGLVAMAFLLSYRDEPRPSLLDRVLLLPLQLYGLAVKAVHSVRRRCGLPALGENASPVAAAKGTVTFGLLQRESGEVAFESGTWVRVATLNSSGKLAIIDAGLLGTDVHENGVVFDAPAGELHVELQIIRLPGLHDKRWVMGVRIQWERGTVDRLEEIGSLGVDYGAACILTEAGFTGVVVPESNGDPARELGDNNDFELVLNGPQGSVVGVAFLTGNGDGLFTLEETLAADRQTGIYINFAARNLKQRIVYSEFVPPGKRGDDEPDDDVTH